MPPATRRFIAAAVQAKPIWLDRAATTRKACDLTREAAAAGAKLVVFPEAWIPTFPYWPRALPYPDKHLSVDAYVALYHQAVEVPGPETALLCQTAASTGAYLVMGLTERDPAFGNTLFNTLLYIGPDGRIVGRHRKLVPTHEERCVWGMGDAADLQVYDTPLGRLSGLICGNNWITLAKYWLLTQGEQVHVAVWPCRRGTAEMADLAVRGYATEGQVFVVSAAGIISRDDVPDDFPLKDRTDWTISGGSGIAGPDGRWLAGPVYDQETIVTAEIDLDQIVAAKAGQDAIGHYARPDAFRLAVRQQPWTNVTTVNPASPDGWRFSPTPPEQRLPHLDQPPTLSNGERLSPTAPIREIQQQSPP